MNRNINTTLGDLISLIYEGLLDQYGDAELASVATAAVINELLAEPTYDEQPERIAA